MDKTLKELMICYIEQFGFDVIIGTMQGVSLVNVIKLKKIAESIRTTIK